MSCTAGQKGKNCITFLYRYYLTFVERLRGALGLVACANYDQEVYNGITRSCKTISGREGKSGHRSDVAVGHKAA